MPTLHSVPAKIRRLRPPASSALTVAKRRMQFQLATLRDGDDSTFAAVVVGDRAIRLADVRSAAAHLGPTLRSRGDVIRDLFVHWDHDFPILQRTATRFGSDARFIASMPLQQFEPCAPFVPRQTFCAVNKAIRTHCA